MDYKSVCAKPSDYKLDDILFALSELDDAYYGSGTPLVSDAEYDYLYDFAKRSAPGHHYFLGVGSDRRGGKVPLPMKMGGLNQVHIGEFDRWVSTSRISDRLAVISDKLDGYSCMIVYGPNGKLRAAFSRGNGTEGADVTRHIRRMNVVDRISWPNSIVRGEIVIKRSDFPNAQSVYKKDDGTPYKNGRNMVAGVMNSKTATPEIYECMSFVAYSVMNSDHGKVDQLRFLGESFEIPWYTTAVFSSLCEERLAKILNARRDAAPYEMDGVVIDVDDPESRARLGVGNDLKPEYAVKFKVADASNVAIVTVTGVEWNVSKHGYLKPTVLLEPVELVGVTVKRASGYNAKFILDNGVGAGARLRITRAGDVIPDILEVIEPAFPDMPSVEWEWNETGVDAVAVEETEEVIALKMKSFFNALKVDKLQDKSIGKLIARGHDSIGRVIALDMAQWALILGVNGTLAYDSLRRKLQDIELWELMGAWPYFYRGFGQTRAKAIVEALGLDCMSAGVDEVSAIEGFDVKTAERFVAGLDGFKAFLSWLQERGLVKIKVAEQAPATGGSLSGLRFAFTGFRDLELEGKIRSLGGEVQSGVKRDTTHLVAKDPTKGSNKLKRAADQGVKVIGRDELLSMIS
jgi:NAD-dependent DNA ligase